MNRLVLPALLVAVLVAGLGLVWSLRTRGSSSPGATAPASAHADASGPASHGVELDRRIPAPDAAVLASPHGGGDEPPSNPRIRNPEREREVRARTEAVLAAHAGKSGAMLHSLECLADQCTVELVVDDMAEFGRAYEALQSPDGYNALAKTIVLMNPIPGPDGRTVVPFALNFDD